MPRRERCIRVQQFRISQSTFEQDQAGHIVHDKELKGIIQYDFYGSINGKTDRDGNTRDGCCLDALLVDANERLLNDGLDGGRTVILENAQSPFERCDQAHTLQGRLEVVRIFHIQLKLGHAQCHAGFLQLW